MLALLYLVRLYLVQNPEFHTSWHDWRSTWTNVAIASGIPLDERERIQGHSNKKRASAIYSREDYDVQRDYLEKHHQVLTQGMEYRGELYMMYADNVMPCTSRLTHHCL